jgi:hypothetical protein
LRGSSILTTIALEGIKRPALIHCTADSVDVIIKLSTNMCQLLLFQEVVSAVDLPVHILVGVDCHMMFII